MNAIILMINTGHDTNAAILLGEQNTTSCYYLYGQTGREMDGWIGKQAATPSALIYKSVEMYVNMYMYVSTPILTFNWSV